MISKRVFLLPLLLSGLALAQGPRGGGFPGGLGRQWWENPVANGLNLTDGQNRQIRSIVAEYRSKLIDLRANEEKAQGDLQDVFNDSPQDQRKANDAIDRLGNARGEMTKIISQMSLRMRNVLTAEQWQELRQRQQDRGRPRLQAPSPDTKAAPGPGPNDPRERRRQFFDGQPGQPQPGQPQPAKPPRL